MDGDTLVPLLQMILYFSSKMIAAPLLKKKKTVLWYCSISRKSINFIKSDGVQAKLQGWQAKLLYQASGTTLISSILQVMPLYTFFCFRVLETVCNKLDLSPEPSGGTMSLELGNYI